MIRRQAVLKTIPHIGVGRLDVRSKQIRVEQGGVQSIGPKLHPKGIQRIRILGKANRQTLKLLSCFGDKFRQANRLQQAGGHPARKG